MRSRLAKLEELASNAKSAPGLFRFDRGALNPKPRTLGLYSRVAEESYGVVCAFLGSGLESMYTFG